MTDQRAAQARLRTPFPRAAPDAASLADGPLATWVRTCMLQHVTASRWSLDRVRWRRALARATRALAARLEAHAGSPPALCGRCRERPATCHIAYAPHEAPRFEHFCATCVESQPRGWFAVTRRSKSATFAD